MLRQREDMEARLARIRAKEKAQRNMYLKGDQGVKRRKVDVDKNDEGDDEQFALEDYESDQEQNASKGGKSAGTFSAATLELMAKIGMGSVTPKEEEEEAEDEIKVSDRACHFFLLLTHHRSSTVRGHILSSPSSSTNSVESTFHLQSKTQTPATPTSKT